MKKIIFALAIVALGIALYSQRTAIKDFVSQTQKPQVEEVAYEEIAEPVVEEPVVDEPVEVVEEPTEPIVEEPEPPTNETPSTIPAEFNLAVPFTSQAPHSNWDEPYQEACEEASSLMAAYYYMGKPAGKINPDEADAAILKIVEFENSFFGYYKDTTASETALLIEAYFHLTTELIQNPTVDQLKEAIAAGHPVIVPAAGRQLGNPNFTPPGPIYHMLVLKGYTDTGFITNDPGTRLGADYFYRYDTIMTAMHDWNGGDVDNGQKVVIVVKP